MQKFSHFSSLKAGNNLFHVFVCDALVKGLVSMKIKGEGSLESPFDFRAREIVKLLLSNPRMTAAEIKRIMKERGIRGFSNFDEADLVSVGSFAEALVFRVALETRWEDRNGYCSPRTGFLDVFLNSTDTEVCRRFETKEITEIADVIEWHRIGGDQDYLVKVAAPPTGEPIQQVAESIRANCPSVKGAKLSHLVVQRSGHVDNINPDNFWNIRERPAELAEVQLSRLPDVNTD